MSMWPIMGLTDEHLKQIRTVSPELDIKIIENNESEIAQEIADADILITSAIPTLPLDKAKSLKLIQTTSAGVNGLSEELVNSDVQITNASGVHPIPIAEHVLTFMLMFSRQLFKLHRLQITEKKWMNDYDFTPATELHGKTIGIVGLGRIGKRIAHLSKAFDMRVIALARTEHAAEENVDEFFTHDKLDTLLGQSDFVVNALPLTDETRHLYTLEKFKKMKPTSFFINIGRGPTVDEEDLIFALKEEVIAGAGLDVFDVEPLAQNSELWNLENVIITPHIAGWTPYYMDRVIEIFCENLKAFLENKPMPTQVDKKLGY